MAGEKDKNRKARPRVARKAPGPDGGATAAVLAVLDEMPDGIVIAVDLKNYWVNRAMEQIFGYTREELIGKGVDFLLVPEEARIVQQRMKDRVAGKNAPTQYETIARRKDGSIIHVDVVAHVTMFDGRRAVHGIVRDITARKRAEEALEKVRAQYTTLVENAPVGVFRTELDGTILYVNKALAAMAGFAREDMMGVDVTRIYRDPAKRRRIIEILQRDGIVHGFENEFVGGDGEPRTGLISAWLEGPTLCGMVVDITDRRRMEQDLLESREELRGLSRHIEEVREAERTEVSREIHDELGQTLTVLKMNLAWLAGRLPGGSSATAERVKATSALLDGTIETVRRLCARLRPGLLDDAGITAAIEWQARDFERHTGIACATRFDPDDLELDRERATALFRIFQEALTNVARHAGARRVEARLSRKENLVVLLVADDGKGITEEEADRPASLGILGMCERARAFGGEIFFSGRPGGGTTLTVRLPLTGP